MKRGHVAENRSEAGEEKNHIPSIINRKIEFLENAGTHPMHLEMPVENWGCCVDVVSTLKICCLRIEKLWLRTLLLFGKRCSV